MTPSGSCPPTRPELAAESRTCPPCAADITRWARVSGQIAPVGQAAVVRQAGLGVAGVQAHAHLDGSRLPRFALQCPLGGERGRQAVGGGGEGREVAIAAGLIDPPAVGLDAGVQDLVVAAQE